MGFEIKVYKELSFGVKLYEKKRLRFGEKVYRMQTFGVKIYKRKSRDFEYGTIQSKASQERSIKKNCGKSLSNIQV